MVNPLLSIIVPIYNVELYLIDCLESIINQSFKDFELILIDDGSTDSSGQIADNYAIMDNRAIVIHQKNSGLSSARNAGLDCAKGEYISFVDSDDIIQEDTYEKNLELLFQDTDIDVVQFPTCRFNNDKVKAKNSAIGCRLLIGEKDIFTNWWEDNVLTGSVWNKIYHKRIFSNIRFPNGHVFEDVFLLVEFSEIVKKAYISDKGCYFYRVREGSITDGTFSLGKGLDLFNAQLKVYKKLYSFEHLKPSRLRAFSRVFRKLVTIKFAYPDSNLDSYLNELKLYLPLWSDIKLSKDKNEYFWIVCVRILGLSGFIYLFCIYLKIKNSRTKF